MANNYFNLSQDYFNEILSYSDGVLYWKKSPARSIKAGTIAGHNKSTLPYKRLQICRKNLLQHRVIFLMHHGYLPDLIDHIDGNPNNNKIENLREATYSKNSLNKKLIKSNKSGFKNVCWDKTRNKWLVSLCVKGKLNKIGFFKDLELANLVAQEARDKYHKQFARHK